MHHGDFRRPAVLRHVQQRDDRGSREVRVAQHRARLVQDVPLRQLHRLELQMANANSDLLERYGKLQHDFERRGGYTYVTRIKQVLTGLGFDASDYDMRLDHLSGGQRTRAFLSRLLLSDPDVLLLDEPTNHLDIRAVEWLESYLAQWDGAAVIERATYADVAAASGARHVRGYLGNEILLGGFDRVFDTSFSADLTIMEESAELIDRIENGGVLPMITSCCPGWVKYAEEFAPEFIPNLSSCKSPQQMMGAIIKTYYAEKEGLKPEEIFSVSIMPCTAKKFEAQRVEMTNEGISDVDAVLTTRELTKFLKLYGIDMFNIQPELTDSPLGFRSTAGKLFGASGGVMEAAIRTAYYKLTGKELVQFQVPAIRGFEGRKETKLDIEGIELGVAVVNGLANAKKLLDEIRNGRDDIHFIEQVWIFFKKF